MDSGNSILIPINCDESEMKAALNEAMDDMKKFGKTAEDVSKYVNNWTVSAEKFSMITVGLKNVASSAMNFMKGLSDSFVTYGDQLDKMAIRTNVSAEDLSKLKFAAEQCGAGFDETVDAIKTFQEQLGAAKLGDAGAIGKLGAVGIDPKDFEGLDAKEQFLKLADHIASIQDPAKQTRTAIELFGEAGYKLLPMFQQGKDGIEELCAEAERLGFAFGGEDVANAAKLSDEFNRMKKSVENLGRQFFASVAESMLPWLEWFRNMMQSVNEFMKANSKLVESIAIVTGIFAAAGVAATAYATAVSAFAMITPIGWIAALTVGVSALGIAWYAVGDAQETVLEKGNALREADYDRMKRLEELADKESLSNSEREEAKRLMDEVNSRYGDLGITIDENTGKINGMTEAQKKFMELARQQKMDDLKKEINRRKKSISESRESDKQGGLFGESYLDSWTGGLEIVSGGLGYQIDSLRTRRKNQRAEDRKAISILEAELDALESGGTPFETQKKENHESDARTLMARNAFENQFWGIDISEPESVQSASAKEAAQKLESIRSQYEEQKKILDALKKELELRRKKGLLTDEENQLQDQLVTQQKELELMKTAAQERVMANYDEQKKLEILKKQEDIQKKIQALTGADKEKSERVKRLEDLRAQNRLYQEQLQLRADLSKTEKTALEVKARTMERGFAQKMLNEGDQQLAMSPQSAQVQIDERAYYRLISDPSASSDAIAKAKQNLEASKKEYQSFSVANTQARMESAEQEYVSKSQTYRQMKSGGTSTDEEILQAQQDAIDAKERADSLRKEFHSMADSAFQSKIDASKPKDVTHAGGGTFSAYEAGQMQSPYEVKMLKIAASLEGFTRRIFEKKESALK